MHRSSNKISTLLVVLLQSQVCVQQTLQNLVANGAKVTDFRHGIVKAPPGALPDTC